jgi:hypothetical protein
MTMRKSIATLRTLLFSCALVSGLVGTANAQDINAPDSQPQEKVSFEKQIMPILADNCFACHGIDAEARQADLRLDVRQAAIDMGAITPGEVDSSSLVERIFETDADFIMPPADSNKQLTQQQKELLKRWIDEGAEYEKHWSLVAPVRPELPEIKNTQWVRNEIDRFVLARLEQEGLSPAQPADARTLFRRLNLDITGLPPNPDETDQFVSDYQRDSEAAMSQWIDKLMNRDGWGEHRARYWLDAARYADTHGMHYDNYREMWPYRDWVIRSFNANQPFDQFTVEQLAGDMLENPTIDQKIATGFQRCNMTTNEGGTIDEENLAIYAADRVQTFGWVYLGLTTNCAQCHDHKFDPISAKDYYSLAAFFRNTTQQAKDGNQKDGLGPVMTVPVEADRKRWKALPGEIAAATKARDDRRVAAEPEFKNWLANVDSKSIGEVPTEGLVLHLPLNEGTGNEVKNRHYVNKDNCVAATNTSLEESFKASSELKWNKDGVIGPAPLTNQGTTINLGTHGDFAVNQAYSVGCWVKPSNNRAGAIVGRMINRNPYRGWDLWQEGNEYGAHLIDSWTGNALKIGTTGNRVKPGMWQHVCVTWDGSGSANGLKIYVDGKIAQTQFLNNTLKKDANTKTETPLLIGGRSAGESPFEGFVQDFILYQRMLEPTEVINIAQIGPLKAALEVPESERTAESSKILFEHYLLNHDAKYAAAEKTLNDLNAEKAAINARSPITHVQVEKDSAPMTHILMRGAYDKPGEEVAAAPPEALHDLPEGAPGNRLGLAKWVIDPNNPLTARVTVNRFWQQLFGQGIVVTTEDFGVMGAPPSHPELLDWMAVDFRESGWDVKRLFKIMLMSATYRQAAVVTPEKLEKDRDNTLLSRGPRFRMDAEMVRDYALYASGLVSRRMYGPSSKPYQPENMWNIVGLPGGDTREFVQDKGPDVYRRSLYTFWKRMSPPPNLEAFNAPNREVCTVRRERTNTPLQALVTLNDPQFVEAARVLAQHAMKNGGDDQGAAIDYIASRTLCRSLSADEVAIVNESYQQFLNHYRDHADDAKKLVMVGQAPVDPDLDPVKLAALTMVCNQILNLDEVLNK